MFISLLFNAFQAFSELAGTMLGRSIVNKHKAYAFHRPSALWIAQIFVDQAFAATQIMVFSIIVYFMTNLARNAGAFFTFYLMVLSGNIAMTLFFRIIGCISPDFDYAVKFAVVTITFFIVTSGYLIQYQSEHVWLRWIYYINVLGLAFSAMMENEFSRINMTCTADSLYPLRPRLYRYQPSSVHSPGLQTRLAPGLWLRLHRSRLLVPSFGVSGATGELSWH